MSAGEIRHGSIDELKFDQNNANAGSEYGDHLLTKSLETSGLGRGVLAAADGTIIAGNHVTRKAGELGFDKVVYVPTDGRTLVVTQRMDIQPGSKAFHEAAIADNKVSEENLTWNLDRVQLIADQYEIDAEAWGFNFDDIPTEEEPERPNYTRKIDPPIYEPSDKAPDLTDLSNESKTLDLLQEIYQAENLPEDIRDFLVAAAHRHRVFNYKKIADYYAHAPANVQRLFESSALVIIDFDSAIERGFVKMTKTLAEAFGKDYFEGVPSEPTDDEPDDTETDEDYAD